MHFAAKSGNIEFYSAMNKRYTLNNQTQRNTKFRLPIYYAIKCNHIDLVQFIISENPRISLDLVDLIATVRHKNKQIYDLIKSKITSDDPASKEKSTVTKLAMEKIKYDFYENEEDFRATYKFVNEIDAEKSLLKAIFKRKSIKITKNSENNFFIEFSNTFSNLLEITEKNLPTIFSLSCSSRQWKTIEYLLNEQEDLLKLISTSQIPNKIIKSLVCFAALLQKPCQIERLIHLLERVSLLESSMKELLFSASASGNFISFLEIYKYWLNTNKAPPLHQIVGAGVGNDDDGVHLLHASASSGHLLLLMLIKSLSQIPFEQFVLAPNHGDLAHSLFYCLRPFSQPQYCFSSFLQRQESFYFLFSHLRNYEYVNIHNNSILHVLSELSSSDSNIHSISEPMLVGFLFFFSPLLFFFNLSIMSTSFSPASPSLSILPFPPSLFTPSLPSYIFFYILSFLLYLVFLPILSLSPFPFLFLIILLPHLSSLLVSFVTSPLLSYFPFPFPFPSPLSFLLQYFPYLSC